MKRLIITASTLLLTAAPALAENISLEPGKWESTTTMSMEMTMNGQTMSMPIGPRSATRCVTPEDATFDPDNVMDENCTMTEYEQSGNTISFSIACTQDGMTMTGDMEMTLSDDRKSTSGSMTMIGSHPQVGQVNITGDVSGQHVGACS